MRYRGKALAVLLASLFWGLSGLVAAADEARTLRRVASSPTLCRSTARRSGGSAGAWGYRLGLAPASARVTCAAGATPSECSAC